MSWGVSPWVYPVWDSMGFLDLGGYFLPHFREVFNYYLLKYFLMAFLFVFFFWDSYDSNVGAFNIVPEVSEAVLTLILFSPLLHVFPPFYLPPHLSYLLCRQILYQLSHQGPQREPNVGLLVICGVPAQQTLGVPASCKS